MKKISVVFVLVIAVAFWVIAGCKHKSTPSPSNLVVTLVNETKDAGRCVAMWTQLDDQGSAVAAGTYRAYIKAGGYESNVGFQISASTPHVQSLCDSSECGIGGGQLPTSFSMAVDSSGYALGDTICIRYELPASTQVLLVIKK